MLFERIFGEESFDFEKICKIRIKVGMSLMLLGFLSITIAFIGQQEGSDMRQMYTCLGIGLAAGGIGVAVKNRMILKNPDLKRTREIMEKDERNRAIGLRCWACTGYTMFLLLYLGILAGGFLDEMIVHVLLVVEALYALLLLGFRLLLQRKM
ncbi:MAG: hypothetical protein HFG66_17885 [Hungatella sp.]|nr:hypothetical protein [Hungatella sp.]